jgi:chromosome segregation ATPase
VEAAQIPWRPIGELFVEKGLITSDELEQALAEQAATGLRLGEILVKRNLISSPELTQALMEQLGREVAKEEGFGSGLWSEIRRRNARVESREPESSDLERSPFGNGLARKLDGRAEEVPEDGEHLGEADFEELRLVLDEPASDSLDAAAQVHGGVDDELNEARAEIAALTVTLAERDRNLAQLQVEIDVLAAAPSDGELDAADHQRVVDEIDALRDELAAAKAQQNELQATLADRENRLAELQVNLEESARRVTELDSALATEREAHAENRRELEEASSRVEQARQALEESERGIAAATSERDDARAEAERVRESLGHHGEQVAALHDELSGNAAALDEERHAHEQTRQRVEQLQSDLDDARATAKRLQRESTELAERAGKLEQKLQTARSDKESLEARLADAQSFEHELDLARDHAARQEIAASDLSHRLVEIESTLSAEREAHAETRRTLEDASGRHQEKLTALETELSASATARDEAGAAAERLQQENTELTERADKLGRKLQTARNDKTILEGQVAAAADRTQELVDRMAGLTRELDEAAAVAKQSSEAKGRILELEETIERLENESAERIRELEQKREAIESLRSDAAARLVEEASGHSETRRVLAQALEELSGRQPEALGETTSGPEDHLCFIADSEGYRLLVRTGPLPAAGDGYEVDGVAYVATRIGRSPLPFDARRCVYLLLR